MPVSGAPLRRIEDAFAVRKPSDNHATAVTTPPCSNSAQRLTALADRLLVNEIAEITAGNAYAAPFVTLLTIARYLLRARPLGAVRRNVATEAFISPPDDRTEADCRIVLPARICEVVSRTRPQPSVTTVSRRGQVARVDDSTDASQAVWPLDLVAPGAPNATPSGVR
jgi:hypothetical protein